MLISDRVLPNFGGFLGGFWGVLGGFGGFWRVRRFKIGRLQGFACGLLQGFACRVLLAGFCRVLRLVVQGLKVSGFEISRALQF